MKIMMEIMPDRIFDVGIAEQHAVTFSAGLATQGMIPFCNIYSSFMQRAYDQVIHDVAMQKLPVVLCLDRSGLVGADGPTHHGVFDWLTFGAFPNIIITAPMDEPRTAKPHVYRQTQKPGPFAIRYPRGRGINTDWRKPFKEIPIGKSRIISRGKDMAILTLGNTGNCGRSHAENGR